MRLAPSAEALTEEFGRVSEGEIADPFLAIVDALRRGMFECNAETIAQFDDVYVTKGRHTKVARTL